MLANVVCALIRYRSYIGIISGFLDFAQVVLMSLAIMSSNNLLPFVQSVLIKRLAESKIH